MDGGTLVIGASNDTIGPAYSLGSIYVFGSTGGQWVQQIRLAASDGQEWDQFGASVDISGSTAIVGSAHDDDLGHGSGSAYIYEYDGTVWHETKILSPDGVVNDHFGSAVTIDGDLAVIGAHAEDDNGSAAGAAYVFRREGSSWIFEAKLLASDGQATHNFGVAVGLSGNVALIGAQAHNGQAEDAGAAYIFRRDPLTFQWTEEAILLPTAGEFAGWFGNAVDLQGDRAIVGAFGFLSGRPGATYVFVNEADTSLWALHQKLQPPGGQYEDYFGRAVAIDGDALIVGAHGDDDNGEESGSAFYYRFEPTANEWMLKAKLVPTDGASGEWFGFGATVRGDTAVIGAPMDDDQAIEAGSAYVFNLPDCADCPADVNGDGTVNVLDLLEVLAAWGATGCPEDINGDGVVDVLDLLEVLAAWGPCA